MAAEYTADFRVIWKPNCSVFTNSGGSTKFLWGELNDNWSGGNESKHAPWGYIASALTSGLELTRSNYNRKYPLGFGLVQWLAGQSGVHHEVPGTLSAEEIDGFLARMRDYHPGSIDEFLEIEVRADIGRYMLVSALKRHENLDRLLNQWGAGLVHTSV